MTTDARRIVAETYKVNLCPLYRAGEAFVFRPPTVWVEGNLPICAQAIEKFLPMVRKIQGGKSPEKFSGTSCGGCQGGEAWFRFRFRDSAAVPDGLTLGQRTLESLARSQLFSHIAPDKLRHAMHLFREVELPAGHVLISRGTQSPGLFVLTHGRLEIVWAGDEGRDIVVAEVGPGECVGEISTLLGSLTTATVRAAELSTVVQIEAANMDLLGQIVPEVPTILARVIASRLIRAGHRLRAEFGKGWRGRLDSIDAGEMVQSLAMGGHTGTLRVRNGNAYFLMRLHNGRAGEMALGDLKGVAAFEAFIEWRDGIFQFDEEPVGPPPPGTLDVTSLLLDALRRRDETKVRA